MSLRLRTLGQGLLWFLAVNFIALLMMVIALAAFGAIEPDRWKGAAQVLRGNATSVPVEELERLRSVERALAERQRMPDEAVLVQSWSALKAEKWKLERQAAEQWARLSLLAGFVERRRDALDRAHDQFVEDRARAEQERLALAQESKRTASEKLQKLYRYMRPDSIAADLEDRMETGRPEEVAQIVKVMPERSAAEVLEAFEDPSKRNRIYDLLAGRAPQELSASTQARP
jgi:flagellar motility protein MotE (MotC chaperone)